MKKKIFFATLGFVLLSVSFGQKNVQTPKKLEKMKEEGSLSLQDDQTRTVVARYLLSLTDYVKPAEQSRKEIRIGLLIKDDEDNSVLNAIQGMAEKHQDKNISVTYFEDIKKIKMYDFVLVDRSSDYGYDECLLYSKGAKVLVVSYNGMGDEYMVNLVKRTDRIGMEINKTNISSDLQVSKNLEKMAERVID